MYKIRHDTRLGAPSLQLPLSVALLNLVFFFILKDIKVFHLCFPLGIHCTFLINFLVPHEAHRLET